jgi:hypothetical protein
MHGSVSVARDAPRGWQQVRAGRQGLFFGAGGGPGVGGGFFEAGMAREEEAVQVSG